MWHVYIIKCSDNSLYTDITYNLLTRIIRHNQRKGGAYTRARTPVTLIYKELYRTKSQALIREAEIKKWTRNKKLTFWLITQVVTRGVGILCIAPTDKIIAFRAAQ